MPGDMLRLPSTYRANSFAAAAAHTAFPATATAVSTPIAIPVFARPAFPTTHSAASMASHQFVLRRSHVRRRRLVMLALARLRMPIPAGWGLARQ